MNAKLMSALVGIVVLATLCSAVPVDDTKDMDQFLALVNGTTCVSNNAVPNGGTYYKYCFVVCVKKNGVRVCYNKCNYSAVAPVVEIPVHESEDMSKFLTEVNGNTCVFGDGKPAENENYYRSCIRICVNYNYNRIPTCYLRCT